ncbi:hypothetical protein V8E36_004552 [Tilletia maclaganii]
MKLLFALPAAVLALQITAAARLPETASLLPRLGGDLRPGQLCTINQDQTDNCVTQCDPTSGCWTDGTCGQHCFLFMLGDSGCLNDGECALGGCVSGTCVRKAGGDDCALNRACESSLCSQEGKCLDNPPLQPKGAVCASSDVCISGECDDQYDGTKQLCRNGGSICEDVTRCSAYQTGQACQVSADCLNGGCLSGTCQLLDTGATCAKRADCKTNRCDENNKCADFSKVGEYCAQGWECTSRNCFQKKCILAGGGQECNSNSLCTTSVCTPYDPHITAGMCKLNGGGGYCRDARDCLSSSCVSNKCAAGAGDACSKSSDCRSGLCEANKCSKDRANAACRTSATCASGQCLLSGPQECGPAGCYDTGFCNPSSDGSNCVVDGDCSPSSWCKGSVPGSSSGQCSAGKRPASTTTSKTTTTSSSKSSTSTKPVTSTSTKSTSTTAKPTTTSTKPASATSVKSTTSTKPASTTSRSSTTSTTSRRSTSTTTSTTTRRTTTTSSTATAKPTGATCSANVDCRSGYCRKGLQSDGVTRNPTGVCDTKKASGQKCYQNGGCLSGTCNKTAKTCT